MFCDPSRIWYLFWGNRRKGPGVVECSLTAMIKLWSVLLVIFLSVLWTFWPGVLVKTKPPQYGGYVHPAFSEVKEVFRKNIESGREPGASFAVYHQGKVLVDLWGGHADKDARKPWQQNTISQAWSCTKGVVAVIMALLVDRGLLNYDEYVRTYWPEFDQNGKSNITVAMLLSHQAGLVSLNRQFSLLEYRDNWAEMERQMAINKPAWVPGTRYCYHAFTFGMYADAIVRKVDPQQRNISQFFKEEIAEPFGLDFYIGLPLDQFFRSARGRYVSLLDIFFSTFIMRPSKWAWLPEAFLGNILWSSLTVFDVMDDVNIMNNAEHQSVGLPSALGFGSARSLAKLYDYLANDGTIDGKQLLSSDQVKSLLMPATENIPVIAAPDYPFSMGMIVFNNVLDQPVFGHPGYGGQNAYADKSHSIGVTYITNFNSEHSDSYDPRALDLLHVFYKCLLKYKSLNGDDK